MSSSLIGAAFLAATLFCGRAHAATAHTDPATPHATVDRANGVHIASLELLSIDAAPHLNFYKSSNSDYRRVIEASVRAGFVVLTPGFRGHGRVHNMPAQGIEFMSVWDNDTYVSPAFYAIDVLNLLEGIDSLEGVTWPRWGVAGGLKLNRHHVNLIGHSQGGDVALIVLAVCGAGSSLKHPATAGSIWSGTFPSRVSQLAVYHPMETTAQAFVAGDGSLNHTAVGADGTENANFVFGYPPDWIGTPEVHQWTWQRKVWSNPTVAVALKQKLDEMYAILNEYVADIHGVSYVLSVGADGKVAVTHDPSVGRALVASAASNARTSSPHPYRCITRIGISIPGRSGTRICARG